MNAKELLAQKVLVRTINEYLRRKLITLAANGNRWGDQPVIEFDMDGIPAVASVADVGHGELSFKATLWPTDHGKKFINAALAGASSRRGMGGFYASAWLERKKGAWLQTSNGLKQVYCARGRRGEVEAVPWEEPLWFEPTGKFMM
ncbi:hypothetical protein DDZ14_01110 [Maritimibacter sp. 55A14]|uniref:hypothetical protein n=1 Tax=Maritimibacter sp. 55A14 TaxID=2174844 RepID=UPI000D607045|nr:hypothetical protein [Maritimibacter sp. 55A14]PWE34339.1 hypothetical protein DDZ14_01110 [Maritimibacter sp. 55A14]